MFRHEEIGANMSMKLGFLDKETMIVEKT